jgi:hypothetical protein
MLASKAIAVVKCMIMSVPKALLYRLKKRRSAGDIEKGADDKPTLTSASREVHEGLPYCSSVASFSELPISK